jgi:hypothetical protein
MVAYWQLISPSGNHDGATCHPNSPIGNSRREPRRSSSGERPVLANLYIRCTLCVHRFSLKKYPSNALILPKFCMYYGQPFYNKISKFKKILIPIAWEIMIFLHHTPKSVSGRLIWTSQTGTSKLLADTVRCEICIQPAYFCNALTLNIWNLPKI